MKYTASGDLETGCTINRNGYPNGIKEASRTKTGPEPAPNDGTMLRARHTWCKKKFGVRHPNRGTETRVRHLDKHVRCGSKAGSPAARLTEHNLSLALNTFIKYVSRIMRHAATS